MTEGALTLESKLSLTSHLSILAEGALLVAGSQPVIEHQGVVPDDKPSLQAIFPRPAGFTNLPIVMRAPAALAWARLHPTPSSTANLGTALPVAPSPRASMPDAASQLAGKRDPELFLFYFFGGRDIHYTKQR